MNKKANTKCQWFYKYPIGTLGIAEEDGYIVQVYFSGGTKERGLQEFKAWETDLIVETGKQLREYFAGERREFDLPLRFKGTEFQRQVWEALLTIPYGETSSYGMVAEQIERPKAVRAVGMANNRNPIVIICPCHRVIGSDGSLTGYGGGLPAKQYLLDLEKGR
ncbi:MAG: methylated-DNA--[protein]-cysteine S-methyltransferase [Clostridiales bacterium]|nr:methylated-DNA--[protein]-cysteine S-methyltransferase [Clostridiales bacterium]